MTVFLSKNAYAPEQVQVYEAMHDAGRPCTVRAISEMTGLDPRVVTSAVQHLRSRAMVEPVGRVRVRYPSGTSALMKQYAPMRGRMKSP